MGMLATRGNGEFRFVYDRDWTIPLSGQLPIHPEGIASYEGPAMPAFFENLLPEGWTERVVLRHSERSYSGRR
ncbi:MAG: HipA N-terminal domain-containing protein [Gemmatimonadetes bacterium]|nr:HipA N-terminal domain-containing protein [Gemmatimonadota bacterium]